MASVRKFDGRRKTGLGRFRRFLEKSAKYGKIRPKRSRDDGGTIEIRNTEIWPVLAINRPISPINR
jgi:hypothetical protein